MEKTTGQKEILIKAKQAQSLIEKTVGLIGQKDEQNLFLKTRFGIHTFFMKNPIDVIILSSSNKIILLKQSLKPWKIYLWNPKYPNVLELPEGKIDELKLKKGDSVKVS